MQSGYGVPEFQQLLVDGCSSLLSMSHDINSSQPQKLHLQDPNHQHPQHHQQQQQQRFHHFQPNSITQQFFQHPLQLQLLQQQQQRRFYQQLGLEQEPGPDNSNSSSRGVGGGGVLPFVVANFKLRDENSGCRGGLNDDETVLVGSGGDSRVAIADHDRWQQQREEDTAIKEPFWIPLDSEYINRNNKRCKDKEEVSNKFCKKDEERDENEERKNSSSNFGLFRELEAIYTHGSLNGGGGCTNQTGSGSALTGENPVTTLAVPKPTCDPRSAIDHASETSTGEEASLKKIKKNKRKRKRMQLSSIAFFFESLVKQLMTHQETLHMKFLEVMEKRDEERTKREEAWRQQEMVKAKREASVRAEEQALASSREAAIVAFLEKITGETINLPTRTQCNSEVQFHEDSQKEQNANQNSEAINNNNVSNENNNCSNNTRRWPKAEVHVLIRVRSSLDSRFQEPGLKGPLWEEVSASMASVGYQRSAKRCKEKWENINKYFRKTKDSAKKRSQFSKTCPYFHQLDQLYSSSSKSSVAKDNSELLDAIVVANDQNPSLEFDGPRFRFSEMGSQSLDFNDNVNEDSSAMARNEEEADNEEEEDDDDDDDDEEEGNPSVQSPLIPSYEKSLESRGGEGLDNVDWKRDIADEVKKQFWLAGPLVAVSFLQFCLQTISVMFVGHLGELSLSSASMATSFAGVTGFSFLLGMGSALDTLCGQSYGAKQYHMLGIHMQRAMCVLLLVSIPLAVIWAYTGQILLALGQDPEISAAAGLYARWMIPCIFAYGLLQCHVRFLQTQNIVFPMVISSGFTALLHLFICWVLVFKSGLGNKGAALANSISYWINVVLLAFYVKFSPACKKTWTGFSKEALHDVFHFIRLAIPSAVMVCLEFWSFELLVLLSGLLPNPKLETSVLSISLNTCSMLFMIPFGLGGAVSTRVSNELGAGRPQTARLAVMVVVVVAVTVGVIVGLTMILVRGIWGCAYSNEGEVVRYVAVLMPVLATSNFLDGIQCVLSGTARGCGWQKIGAYVNLAAYYIVGIPSAVLLAFVLHVGGKGLWMGIVCGLMAQVLMLSTITLCTNWEQEAKKAKDRVYGSTIPIDLAS